MAEEQQFCLRWNNFQVNITSQFEALRDDEDFVDVTLACEGKRLKAHKVVLSACSPYFKDLFKSNPCKHPILFMRDVEFHHLQALVEFMYAGEVNIAQAQLSAFLRTAESLQIRGLTEAPQRHKQIDGFSNVASQARAGSGSTSRRVGSPGGGSRTSSPEDGEQEGAEEEVMSLSPPGSPPAKRACRTGEKVNALEALDDSGSVSSQQRASHPEQYESIKCESIDIVEPKVEVPDYCSDGEGRVDNTGVSGMYPGMDNSVDAPPAFPGLQASGMVMLPGTSSQGYMGEAMQDSGQADQRKLHSLDPRPCPICYRMYSNLSNLRQHLRLIHNPQTVSCPLCSKPFKTKLYLKRHLMSFHELVCTTPKNSTAAASAAGAPKGSAGASDFFQTAQVVLGKGQPQDDRNSVQNPDSTAKVKDAAAQDLVAEFFQNRGSYQGSKGSNGTTGGFQGSKAKPVGLGDDRNSYQASPEMGVFPNVKDDRAPFPLRNQDRFPLVQANKGPEVGGFLPPASNDSRYSMTPQPARGVGGERPVPYHAQASNTPQESAPSFLNMLSLGKSDENSVFLSTSQQHPNENEKCAESAPIGQDSNNDITST